MTRSEARFILAFAAIPARAARLTKVRRKALLAKAGRTRGLDTEAQRLFDAFRAERLRQPALVENAIGAQLAALLLQLDGACQGADDLEEQARASFEQHPDAPAITSFSGMGTLVGARVLVELSDDRSRFADARCLKAFAGSAPVARASGKKTVIMCRQIKNNWLAAAGSIWAFGSLRSSPGARAHFEARRTAGDWNRSAQRHLFNKLLGQLHHCLQTGIAHNENHAFSPPLQLAAWLCLLEMSFLCLRANGARR
ncbi:IS110 family transposase [Segniliparus rugosus]|uniref:Transposase IS116/IS110/IS902 C-terminal domain-containing protein n=1 Tax=Segniliparus rugosus (strain ATCC BAA-974 / DSM 45345 / CCUG 50838 / CIP 108380 / JCM 13579 / CDC 945) TaxID=679197 RepID=E5XU84_SEGRC|nr:IS110 family transposase [Segniliparus rugosus]EFV12083.1 hypothetical protein HMPREF9336_03056 [Segniliparus rugosus ATCC BAA-974]